MFREVELGGEMRGKFKINDFCDLRGEGIWKVGEGMAEDDTLVVEDCVLWGESVDGEEGAEGEDVFLCAVCQYG